MSSTLPKALQAAASEHCDAGNVPTDVKDFIRNKLKNLPDDFLRLPCSGRDNLFAHTSADGVGRPLSTGLHMMLDISVVEAMLVKNYGLLRMDLYCKIRVGHMVCETQTCPNGAKNPKWDGVYQFNLKPGINTFHVEIYDEKQFSTDEKIAWLYDEIPAEVFQGMTVERWFPLSGRLGPGKEGSILLVLSVKRVSLPQNLPIGIEQLLQQPQISGGQSVFIPSTNVPHVIGGHSSGNAGPQIPVYVQPPNTQPTEPQPTPPAGLHQDPTASPLAIEHSQAPATPVAVTEEDITQLGEMFPSIDKAIIKAVLENNQGNKEASISFLLTLG